MKALYGTLAAVSLVACTAIPFVYFWSGVTMEEYKTILFLASICWFVFAALWSRQRGESRKP
jgi:hypothetical protein